MKYTIHPKGGSYLSHVYKDWQPIQRVREYIMILETTVEEFRKHKQIKLLLFAELLKVRNEI